MIKKLVIPAAGLGTRFLPATKSLAKEMIPIINVPTIHFIVEEAIKSGIEEILIIVSSQKNSIIDYFDHSYELEHRLLEKNKKKEYDMINNISNMANIHFIRQKEPKGLGHAIRCAKTFIGNEPFAVILGDDLVFAEENQKPALLQCIEAYDKTSSSIVGTQPVKKEDIHKYGIVDPVDPNEVKNGVFKLKGMLEKPDASIAPSNQAILGRYVLTPDIFDAIDRVKPDKSGEIQITDALMDLAKNSKNGVYACCFNGRRFDIGSKVGFIDAILYQASKDDEIKDRIKEFIKNNY